MFKGSSGTVDVHTYIVVVPKAPAYPTPASLAYDTDDSGVSPSVRRGYFWSFWLAAHTGFTEHGYISRPASAPVTPVTLTEGSAVESTSNMSLWNPYPPVIRRELKEPRTVRVRS